MIQRVYEQARTAQLLHRIIVATDDARIFRSCQFFGAEVRMTSSHHHSGTERVCEIAEKIDSPLIINIQGDHPVFEGEMIDDLIQALQDETLPMATLAFKRKDLHLFREENVVKVVMDRNDQALYFSRSPVPFHAQDYFWHHVGIYGYQKDFLLNWSRLPLSRLEQTERLEQLRVLENGHKIKIIKTSHPCLSVDSPQDIINIENYLKKTKND